MFGQSNIGRSIRVMRTEELPLAILFLKNIRQHLYPEVSTKFSTGKSDLTIDEEVITFNYRPLSPSLFHVPNGFAY